MRFGILAHPAGHSLSPAIFGKFFKTSGVDATYEIFDIEPSGLSEFIMKVKSDGGIKGLSVSSPYKEEIMKFLDEISPDARMIGAVNTVSCEGGKLRGFNTDYVGAVVALKEKIADLKGKKVVVLGAGGASRAIVYGLLKEGAEVCLLNRTVGKAKMVADHFGISYGDLGEIMKHECDILIQTTSVLIDIPVGFFKKGMVVMDIVYKPLITPLLTKAGKAGCEIITGDRMLLHQAEGQFEIWFGRKVPIGM